MLHYVSYAGLAAPLTRKFSSPLNLSRLFPELTKGFSTTTNPQRQSPVQGSVINRISYDLTSVMPSAQVKNLGSIRTSSELSDPPLQFMYKEPGPIKRLKSVLAAEVAFSSPSEELKEQAKNLFSKSTVNVVIMFDIKETPNYKNPFSRRQNIELYKLNCGEIDPENSLSLDENEDPLYSPVYVYGVRCAGELTGAVQVWTRDPVTRKPVEKTKKIYFYGRPELVAEKREQHHKKNSVKGKRSKLIPEDYPKLNLKLSDVIPLQKGQLDKDLTFDWDSMRDSLSDARLVLAEERFESALERLRRDGNI